MARGDTETAFLEPAENDGTTLVRARVMWLNQRGHFGLPPEAPAVVEPLATSSLRLEGSRPSSRLGGLRHCRATSSTKTPILSSRPTNISTSHRTNWLLLISIRTTYRSASESTTTEGTSRKQCYGAISNTRNALMRSSSREAPLTAFVEDRRGLQRRCGWRRPIWARHHAPDEERSTGCRRRVEPGRAPILARRPPRRSTERLEPGRGAWAAGIPSVGQVQPAL